MLCTPAGRGCPFRLRENKHPAYTQTVSLEKPSICTVRLRPKKMPAMEKESLGFRQWYDLRFENSARGFASAAEEQVLEEMVS